MSDDHWFGYGSQENYEFRKRTRSGYECPRCGYIPTWLELDRNINCCRRTTMMRTIKALGKTVPADAMLMALYNNTNPVGRFVGKDRGPITREEARDALISLQKDGKWPPFTFDYFGSRPLKVTERDGEIDGALYERDAGEGAFARAVEAALALDEAPDDEEPGDDEE